MRRLADVKVPCDVPSSEERSHIRWLVSEALDSLGRAMAMVTSGSAEEQALLASIDDLKDLRGDKREDK